MKRRAVLLLGTLTLALVGQVSVAQAQTTSYTGQPLPFDANAATPRSGWFSGLTSSSALDLGEGDPVSAVFTVINVLLTLLGLVFLVLLLYAGVIWVLARGNEEDITRAKAILRRGLVGLVIILASYGISWLTFIYIDAYTSL